MRICFASHNKNKVAELNHILNDIHTIYGLDDLGVFEDIPETGNTLEENSIIKASYVHEKFHVPVFADDSGLLIKALNDAPGVFSARYAGEHRNDEDNMRLVLRKLEGIADRKAQFKTVITFINKEGIQHQFTGSIAGNITKEKRGDHGFGYDPIFQPDGYDATFAELPSAVKNLISHRAQAVQKLIKHLEEING